MAINVSNGVLADANPFVVAIAYWDPADNEKTLYLNSAAAGRLIEISVDGTNYFTPAYDYVSTAQISSVISARVTNVRFTGVLNDTWGIL